MNTGEPGAAPSSLSAEMEMDELIGKMRGRVALCRRLAAGTTDPRTASILRAMAHEGETDIKRLLEESDES